MAVEAVFVNSLNVELVSDCACERSDATPAVNESNDETVVVVIALAILVVAAVIEDSREPQGLQQGV